MKKADDTKQENIEEINEELVAAVAQGEEWKTKYMRVLADYQNLERRTREEKQEIRQYAAEVILGRLLPVVDTFSKVKEHIKDVGLDLAYKELQAVLVEHGVEHIQVVGRPFDPHEMECIEVVEGKENEVISELLPGYRFGDKILRIAQVTVGKKHTN